MNSHGGEFSGASSSLTIRGPFQVTFDRMLDTTRLRHTGGDRSGINGH